MVQVYVEVLETEAAVQLAVPVPLLLKVAPVMFGWLRDMQAARVPDDANVTVCVV